MANTVRVIVHRADDSTVYSTSLDGALADARDHLSQEDTLSVSITKET